MSELKLIMPHTEPLVFLLNFSRFEIMRTTSDSSFYLFFCNQFVILQFVVSHLSLPPCFHITLSSQTLPPLLLFPSLKKTPRLQQSLDLCSLSQPSGPQIMVNSSQNTSLLLLSLGSTIFNVQYSNLLSRSFISWSYFIFLSLTPFIPFQSNHYLLLFGHNFLFLCLCSKYSISNTLSSGLTQRQQSSPASAIACLHACACFRSLTLAREQRLNFYLYNKLNKRALQMNVLRLHMHACIYQTGQVLTFKGHFAPSWIFFKLDVIAIFKYGTTELSKSLAGKWKNLTLVHFLFFFFLPRLHPHNSSCFNSGLSSTVFLY